MKFISLPSALLASVALAGSLSAQVLMLDFGPTTVAESDKSNSPYHTATSSSSNRTWNTLSNDDPGTLKWADGTTANGITAMLGIGSATADYETISAIDLGANPSHIGSLGGAIKTGIYAGSTAGRDGIYTSVTPDNAYSSIGLQIAGLSTGTYDIYITARNTSTAGHSQLLYAGKSSSAGNFTYSDYETRTLSYSGTSTFGTDAWTEGVNYAKLSVTLTSGEVVNIVSLGGEFQNRAFLNSVQIVSSIPEPSTFAFLGGLGALAVAVLRRRNRIA